MLTMLRPSVQVQEREGFLLAEFWDCLRLDPAPIHDLRKRFDDHVRRGGKPILLIDLSGVTFAGSAALGVFVNLQRDCRQNQGRMAFCNVEDTVLEAFRVSSLEPLFEFLGPLDQAIPVLLDGSASRAPTPRPNSENNSPDTPPRPAPPLRSRRKSE
jgi:anti-anti-sigma factor